MEMPRRWLAVPVLLALLFPLMGSCAGIGVSVGTGGASIGISGGVKGDPVLTSFDGRAFEFMGEVGRFYNLISEQSHQLTMKLKLGQMWDHNGTYMSGLGFMYQKHNIVAEVGEDNNLAVTLDGKQLEMLAGETEQEHIMALEKGELMLQWEQHRIGVGQAIEITSELLSVVVYLTPAGTVDEGGVEQPAYLNIDALLPGPPAGALKGVIGEGYERLTSPNAVAEEDDFKFHGDERDYEVDGYFSTAHRHCVFGAAASSARAKRRLAERTAVAFPLRFGSAKSTPPHPPPGSSMRRDSSCPMHADT